MVGGLNDATRWDRPDGGRRSVSGRHQGVTHEQIIAPPVHPFLVVDVGAPQLARGGIGGVEGDDAALSPLIPDQIDVFVTDAEVVDAVQARVRRVDLPGDAHAVDEVPGEESGVLCAAVVAAGSVR